MAKPGKMTIQLAWHTPIATLRELHDKLDPKYRKRFARRLRELERLRAAHGIVEPTVAPNDESNGESRSQCP
jgi:hypothetical protein